VMVNVGSVCQPRDGNRKACYVVLDDGEEGKPPQQAQATATLDAKKPYTLTFRRIDYPAEITRQKIYDIPDLDNFLGDRLLEGR